MNKNEFEEKLSKLPVVEPDEMDEKALARIAENKDDYIVAQKELDADVTYSGKISLRLPKTLHKELVIKARSEGISLNQFILYKLAR